MLESYSLLGVTLMAFLIVITLVVLTSVVIELRQEWKLSHEVCRTDESVFDWKKDAPNDFN